MGREGERRDGLSEYERTSLVNVYWIGRMARRLCRGSTGVGAEATRYAAEGVILGDLGKFDEALVDFPLHSPDWGSKREERDDHGMEDSPPVRKIQASNGVPQDMEHLNC